MLSNFMCNYDQHIDKTPEQVRCVSSACIRCVGPLASRTWVFLFRYADDGRVVAQSPERLSKIMRVIVVVCAAFGLTVSEAKTEIMYQRTKGMPESIAICSVDAAGQVYNQTNEFVYLGGGGRQPQRRSVRRGGPAHTQRMVQLLGVQPCTVRPTERSPQVQNPDTKSRGT